MRYLFTSAQVLWWVSFFQSMRPKRVLKYPCLLRNWNHDSTLINMHQAASYCGGFVICKELKKRLDPDSEPSVQILHSAFWLSPEATHDFS